MLILTPGAAERPDLVGLSTTWSIRLPTIYPLYVKIGSAKSWKNPLPTLPSTSLQH